MLVSLGSLINAPDKKKRGINDGSGGAPAGVSPQHPNLLTTGSVVYLALTPGSWTSCPTSLTIASPSAGVTATATPSLQHSLTTAPTVVSNGSNYSVGDHITLSNNAVVQVTALSGNGVLTVGLLNLGSITSGPAPANPVAQVSASSSGSGVTFNLSWTLGPATMTGNGSGYALGAAPAVTINGGTGTGGSYTGVTYGARPNWKVAGVDYGVGYPSGQSFTDWQALSGTGISVNTSTGLVTYNGLTNPVVSGVDFSLHGGAVLSFTGCTNPVVQNCNFGVKSFPAPSAFVSAQIITDSATVGLTVKYCVIDGNLYSSNFGFCAITPRNSGSTVIQYNWIKNTDGQAVSMGGNPQNNINLDYRFNLLENVVNNGALSAHPNVLQWSGIGTGMVQALVQFNTVIQPYATQGGGEGFQFYPNIGSTGLTNPICEYNTILAQGSNGNIQAMSYCIHGDSTSPVVHDTGGRMDNNWLDVTGAFGPFYPGSFSVGWTIFNNLSVIDGSAFTNSP